MEPTAIMGALQSDSDSYQRAAVQAAMDQKDEIVPLLLAYLERILESPDGYASAEEHTHLPFYAVHLLSYHQVRDAHPLLVALLSLPGEMPLDLFGDDVHEGFPKALWMTSGGEPTAIIHLVEDQTVNAYCRAAAIHALVYGVAEHSLSREEVIAVLQNLFTCKEVAGNVGLVLSSAASHLARLWPGESMDILREAFAEGWIEPFFISMKEVEYYLDQGREARLAALAEQAQRDLPATPHDDLEGWACFNRLSAGWTTIDVQRTENRSSRSAAKEKRRTARKKAKRERSKQKRKKKKKKR